MIVQDGEGSYDPGTGYVTKTGQTYPTSNPDFVPQQGGNAVKFNPDSSVSVTEGGVSKTLSKEEYNSYIHNTGNITNKVSSLQQADYASNIENMTNKAAAEMQAKINVAHKQQGYSNSQQAQDLANIGFVPTDPTQDQIAQNNPAENTGARIEQGALQAGIGLAAGAGGGAAVGAIGGSIVPGAGTVVGAAVGGAVGAVGGAIAGFLHGYTGTTSTQVKADTNYQYKDFLAQKTNIQKMINDLHAGASPAGVTSEYQQAINRMNVDLNAMSQTTKTAVGEDRATAISKMASVKSFLDNRGNIGGSDTLLREAIVAPNPTRVANLMTAQDYSEALSTQ